MFLRYFTPIILLFIGLSCDASAQAPVEGDYIHECQLSHADLATPATIWSWATQTPPEDGDLYGNEMEAAILIWHYFGKEGLEPYKKSRGVAGITAATRGKLNPLIGAKGSLNGGLQYMSRWKASYETPQQKKQRKKTVKIEKALHNGNVSSKHYPDGPTGSLLTYAFSTLGHCHKKRNESVYKEYASKPRIDGYQFALGPFPTSLCDAAYTKAIDPSLNIKDQTSIRRWRGNYRSQKARGAEACAFMPSIYAEDPDFSKQMKSATLDRATKFYEQSRLNSASYCFAGITANPSVDRMMNSTFWRLRDDPERNMTDKTIKAMDPGDNRISMWSVQAAYEVWKYYRGGVETLRDPMYLGKCHSSLQHFYCGFAKDKNVPRALSVSSRVRKSDKLRALSDAMPAEMTEHSKEFIRQNLGDCALKPENMTPITVQKSAKYKVLPQGQCRSLEGYLTGKINEGWKIHQDDRAWLLKWQKKNARGDAQCINDFPWEAMNNMRETWKAEARRAAYEQQRRSELSAAAAEAEAYKARYNAALYGNNAPAGSYTAPRSASEIEKDIIGYQNYQEVTRCTNPTAKGC